MPSIPAVHARAAATGAAVLAVQALALVALSVTASLRMPVPVFLDPPVFSGEDVAVVARGPLGEVEPVWAMTVALVVGALGLLLSARRGTSARASRPAASVLHWVAVSQVLGISTVVIALLNGLVAAPAIVLVYALAAGSALLGWLQDRQDRPSVGRGHLWHYASLTVFAMVPWGAVALVQITGLVLGVPASGGVRVTTLVVLGGIAAWGVAEWAIARPAGPARTAAGAGWLRAVSLTALVSVSAGAVATLALLGG